MAKQCFVENDAQISKIIMIMIIIFLCIPKGSAPHTGGDQIYETGSDYSEDTTNSKTISGSTEAPRSTKAVEPIVHEGEQG